ncbi:MAG: DUF190 domain-containing protein [Bacteroidales bacterium]|jgi:PII-like signaling protein|nr:DUF190 domain-containing protein [Bacteroidales bacterium]
MEEQHNSILKIYASTTDKINNQMLYEYIVLKAREEGISGVTVFRGIMGYGSSSKISSSQYWELTEKLPIVIELIDKTALIDRFYKKINPDLLNMPKGCLVLMESVNVLLKKAGK